MRSTVLAVVLFVAAGIAIVAQEATGPAGRLPPGVHSGRALQTVPDKWMWHMGMRRGLYEIAWVASLEIKKATGTVRVDGQPCTVMNYRASLEYWLPGMRAQYTCASADGRMHKAIEVVSGQFAWDEDMPGAGLVGGKGTPSSKPAALAERLIRIWSGPQGAAKAAAAAGANLKVAMEGGKTVLTYPIPGVAGATARATLSNGSNDDVPCSSFCAERIEIKQGNSVTEFLYSDYADLNEPLNRIDAWYPRHEIEKRDGVTIRDLSIAETETGNPYVIMPVPESVRAAGTPTK